MKISRSALFVALICVIAIAACKKENQKMKTLAPGVYGAGASRENNGYYAAYWANGEEKLLETTGTSVANGIAIKGNDIYVAGWRVAASGFNAATLWINGTRTTLPSDDIHGSQASSITINGDDIYAAGSIGSTPQTEVAAYWKNGAATQLPDIGSGSYAQAITVKGSDVYVAGYVHDGDGLKAAWWKNGVLTLPDPGSKYSQVWGIAVNDAGVHLAGEVNMENFEPFTPKSTVAYWKNVTLTQLSDNSRAIGYCIATLGSDVYVGGYVETPSGETLGYWKNGVFAPLSVTDEDGYATAIAVQGSDIYIAGSIAKDYDGQRPAYWKNGERTMLSNNFGWVGSITVIAK